MSEWRFELDDVGEDDDRSDERVEPGSPTLENAFFVVLGMATTLLVLVLVLTG